MHRTVSAIAASAILAWSAAPALAQQTATSPAPAATSQTPSTNPNRTATMPMAPQANYGQLIAALNQTRSEVARLRATSSLTTNNVHIVKVQTIVTPDNMTALNAALARNQSQTAAMRQALGATRVTATTDNSTITLAQFLSDNRIPLNQVVALDVGSAVTIFVQ